MEDEQLKHTTVTEE